MTTKFLSRLLAALCLVLSGWQTRAEEPDEFLPWVESPGTLYVDSGVIGGIGTKVRANMTWTYVGADACMLGSRVDTGNTRFWLLYVDRATWHMFLAAGTYKRLDDVTIKDGERHTFLADASTKTMTLAVDDKTSTYTYTASSEYSTELNMFIFACNRGGVAQNFSKARLFDMKIWQNGELKRDLRPCVKNGRAGLYDSVSQTILYPVGGEFRYPSFPDATLDYIESTGSQWIDTGVKGQAGVSGEGDFAYTQFGGEQTLLGVYNGPNRNQDFVAFDYDGSGTWSTYGNGWGWATGNNGRAPKGLRAGTLTANTRYRMSFDYQQDSQKVSFVDEAGNELSDSRKSEFESVDTQLNLYLFAADSNGTANYFSKAECYYVNLYVDGELVRQFVPCVTEGQDGDSANALYDKVDGKIYRFGEAAVAGTPAVVYDYSPSKTVDQMPHPLVSNGSSQYIDTGVVGKTGVRAELGVRWLVAGDTDHAMLATRNTTKNLHYNMLTVDKTGLYARCGTTGLRVPRGGLDGERAPGTDFHKYDILFSTTGRKYVFDGTVAFDTNLSVDSGELYLFARNRMDTQSAVLLAYARCYGLKLWKRSEDGETKTLLRDFIPCEKGGRAMLFDKSEGVMYPPASGTLVAGGGRKAITFEEIKYIESGADQYVDTGIIGRQGTAAEMVMEWASPLGTTDYAYLGSRGYEITNQRISMLVICYKDVWLGYGKSQRILNDAFSPDTRYRLVTDYQNGHHTHTRNGVVKYDDCIQEGDMDTGYPMYLFGLNLGGRFMYPSHARCYSLKISQDGTVVRDYRPVLTSLGLATLYDAANDRLVPLATGPFMTYGDLKGGLCVILR